MKDDVIYRQAAIDALNEVSEHYTDKGREWHPHVNFMVEAIEALPSAQPELIRCKDCKYNLNNPRPYADDDPIETFIHCQFMEASDFCSKGKRMEMEGDS